MSRHEGLHREYDGAIDWCSLLPLLRQNFENEGAGDFSDSQWLSLKHRRSDKTRFQFCLDSTRESHLPPTQGHLGGALVGPVLLDNVEIPFGWEGVPLPRQRCTDDAVPSCKQGLSQVEGAPKKDCRLSSSQLWTPWAMKSTRTIKI